MPLGERTRLQTIVAAHARSAAAVHAGDPARSRRRVCPCRQRRGRGRRRHAGLCGPLRSRRIRRRAGARGAAARPRVARSMPAWPRSPTRWRCTRRPRGRSRSTGPTRSASTAGWSAAGGSPGRRTRPENEPPAWLVFGAMIRTVAMGEDEPGLRPLSAALEEEGFDDFGSGRLVESFARHLMVAIDAWQEKGFGEVAKSYLARLAPESGVRRDIDDNGDLLVRRTVADGRGRAPRAGARAGRSHRGSIPRPEARADDANSASDSRWSSVRRHWLAAARRRESGMKLLRTIRLDPSDTFVFERAAEPGEWAVSGAFMFADADPETLEGKPRAAFRGGFLGVASFGLVDAGADRRGKRRRSRGAGRDAGEAACRASRRARSGACARRRRRGGRVRGFALRSSRTTR